MQFVKPWRSDSACVRACRAYLCIGNLSVFGLGVALLSVGVTRTSQWPENQSFLLNPYVGCTALGALAVPVALLGCLGAARVNRLVLFAYMQMVCVSATLQLYACVLLYLCARTSVELSHKLAGYVSGTAEVTASESGAAARTLAACGSVLAASAALTVVSMFCAARAAGWRWAHAKMPAMLNVVNFVLAAVMLALAVRVNALESDNNTRFAVAISCIGLLSTLFGFFALFTRYPRCLRFHVALSLAVALMCVITATACVASGNVRAAEAVCSARIDDAIAMGGNATWGAEPPTPQGVRGPADPACVVPSRLTSDRLLLLGAYTVTAAAAVFAEVLFLVRDTIGVQEPVADKSTVELMYGRFVEDAKQRAAKEEAP